MSAVITFHLGGENIRQLLLKTRHCVTTLYHNVQARHCNSFKTTFSAPRKACEVSWMETPAGDDADAAEESDVSFTPLWQVCYDSHGEHNSWLVANQRKS